MSAFKFQRLQQSAFELVAAGRSPSTRRTGRGAVGGAAFPSAPPARVMIPVRTPPSLPATNAPDDFRDSPVAPVSCPVAKRGADEPVAGGADPLRAGMSLCLPRRATGRPCGDA